jgi:membrane protease YdiL (CAAX protease family)
VTLSVIAIVRWGERRPLDSIGVRAPGWRSLAWAAVLAAGYIFVVTPLMQLLLRRWGARGFDETIGALAALPSWWRVTIVVIGGTVEELLYRGYAFARLQPLVGSRALAAVIVSVVFAYAHTPQWGVAVSTALLLPGLAATAFYAWRRDLPANIIAHVVTDLRGLA